MGKGEQTRAMILARVAPLFNQQGYFGSSLSDIMQQTGLEKGGIYNHFKSKEQLALEAFDYSYAILDQRIRAVLAGKKHAIERLYALLSYFQELANDPPIPGGCPILNTAVEADDAEPALRDRARGAMDELRSTVRRIISKGIERGEIRPGIDVETWSSVMIAAPSHIYSIALNAILSEGRLSLRVQEGSVRMLVMKFLYTRESVLPPSKKS